MAKVVSLRVDDELLEWATSYAEARGVSRTDLLVEGLKNFREDCERGVPEIRERARQAALGAPTGSCPRSPAGHQWAPASVDARRSCAHCGRPGRDGVSEEGGFFAEATLARAELFSGLRFPGSANGVKR